MLCSPGDKKLYVLLFPLPQELDRMAEGEGEEGKMAQMSVIKPLHKIVSEHKDVNKIVIQLNSIISTFKGEVEDVLKDFNKYSDLWSVVSDFDHPDMICHILYAYTVQGQCTHILIRSNTHLWSHSFCLSHSCIDKTLAYPQSIVFYRTILNSYLNSVTCDLNFEFIFF